MFWPKRNKEENRYYLLPGMARSNRKHHYQTLKWAFVIGLICSGLVAWFIYDASRR